MGSIFTETLCFLYAVGWLVTRWVDFALAPGSSNASFNSTFGLDMFTVVCFPLTLEMVHLEIL